MLKLTPRVIQIVDQPILFCELDSSASSYFTLYSVDQFWDKQLQKFLKEFEYKYLASSGSLKTIFLVANYPE